MGRCRRFPAEADRPRASAPTRNCWRTCFHFIPQCGRSSGGRRPSCGARGHFGTPKQLRQAPGPQPLNKMMPYRHNVLLDTGTVQYPYSDKEGPTMETTLLNKQCQRDHLPAASALAMLTTMSGSVGYFHPYIFRMCMRSWRSAASSLYSPPQHIRNNNGRLIYHTTFRCCSSVGLPPDLRHSRSDSIETFRLPVGNPGYPVHLMHSQACIRLRLAAPCNHSARVYQLR